MQTLPVVGNVPVSARAFDYDEPDCIGSCCTGDCCSDPCCTSPDCCGSSDACCGSNPCCGVSDDPCCLNPDDECCNNPDPCCGEECCDTQCCGNQPCYGDSRCDAPGCTPGVDECCQDPCCADDCSQEACCYDCTAGGSLSGGSVAVGEDPICVGESLTFTLSGVVDTPGEITENCDSHPTPSGLSYTWVIARSGSIGGPSTIAAAGTGTVATISPTTQPGWYKCTFTAERECAPALIIDETAAGQPPPPS